MCSSVSARRRPIDVNGACRSIGCRLNAPNVLDAGYVEAGRELQDLLVCGCMGCRRIFHVAARSVVEGFHEAERRAIAPNENVACLLGPEAVDVRRPGVHARSSNLNARTEELEGASLERRVADGGS